MSKHLMYIVALALGVAVAACATQYQPRGFTGGYVDRQIDANTYKVTFSGNGYASSDRIDKSLLYRCAELTAAAGYDYFVIVEGRMTRDEPYFTTPGSKNVATATIKVFRGAKPVNNSNAYEAQAILQTLGPQLITQSTTGNRSQTANQHRNETITPPTEGPRPSALAADALQRGKAAYDRQDYLTAFREWLPLAQQGNALAQYNMGLMYDKGQGVAQDNALALHWYLHAAVQGVALAQLNLGFMYAEGRGVTKNEVEAVHWYRQAAAQGNAQAQNNLGIMYAQGRGVAQDNTEAVRLTRQAAAQGNDDAHGNLGWMYEQGRGVPRDLAEAQRWYAKAAELFPPGPKRTSVIEARDRVARQVAANQATTSLPNDMSNAMTLRRDVARLAASLDEVRLSIQRFQGEYWLLQSPARAQEGATRQAEARGHVARASTALVKLWEGVQQLRAGIKDADTRWGSLGDSRQRAEIQHDVARLAVALDEVVGQLQRLQEKLQETETRLAALATPPSAAANSSLSRVEEIPLTKVGGVYELPVEINEVLTLKFVLDSGAAEVNLPADVVLTLVRTGTIKKTDFLPGKTYTLADGLPVNSERFQLRSLKIGKRRVTNIAASIGPVSSPLLLGQSFLEKLGAWGIDSQRQFLTLGTQGQQQEPTQRQRDGEPQKIERLRHRSGQ